MIYKMTLADSTDSMTFDLLEVPIADQDIEGAVDNTLVNGNVFTDYLWLKKQWTQKWALMCDDEYTQLRGFYTRQWENAEAPTYRLFYGNNVTEDVMRNGSYITENIDAPLGAEMTLTQLSGNAEQNALPSAYQAVEYIQSSGTQRIETDYIFTQGDYIEFKFAPMATDDVAMFGSYESGAVCELGLLNNEIRGNTASAGLGYTYTTGTTYTATNQNGQWSIGGTSFGWQRDTTTTLKSFIFARNYSSPTAYKPASMKFYSLLVKRGGAIVYNFVPCYRKGDGMIGVYETVNEKFFRNAGTGYFTKGSDAIVAPTPEMSQAIETVTGGQTVAVTGKNLMPMASADMTEERQANFSMSLPAGAYTVSFNLDSFTLGTNTSFTLAMLINGAGGSQIVDVRLLVLTSSTSLGQHSVAFTLPANGTTDAPDNIRIGLTHWNNGARAKLSNVQIEAGSTATTYEPYQSQSYEINLGKNLLDVSNVNTGSGSNGLTMTANSDGSLTWAGTATSVWAVLTTYTTVNLKAGTYTLSIDKTLAHRFYVEAVLEDSTTQNMIIEAGQTSKTVTFAKGIKQIRLDLANITNGQAYNETVKAQLEQSATPTDFAPYFTPIELAKVGTYQDRIYEDDDKWYIEKQVGKLTWNGSENWLINNSGTQNFYYVLRSLELGLTSNVTTLMSNYGSYGEIGNTNTTQGMMLFTANNNEIRIRYGSEMALADWKAKLASLNMVLYYALATPTTTEITDETLLSQLNFIANLYGGVNHISLVPSAGAQGTMEVKIHKIYEQETEIYPQTAVRLTLTDDGIINPCGCRRNVQIKMRETIQ